MLLKNYKTIFISELTSIYDEVEAESFFYLSLEKLYNLKRIDLALQPNFELTGCEVDNWNNILDDLKSQKPIQYILGETEFYGLPFLVNENVLIPRPETEELVQLIIVESQMIKKETIRILDIGTGSGCIAVSLAKKLPHAEVFAIDVSEEALKVAQKNAEINQVSISFIQTNILETNNLTQLSTNNQQPTTEFDVIVSNPPYVRHLEKEEIKKNVLDYEPHLALFVEDNDALLFYRKIAQLSKTSLTQNGKLYFEINQYLGKETVELLEELEYENIKLLKDIYDNDRMIVSTNLEIRSTKN